MSQQSLPKLVLQAQQLLTQIHQHPQYQALKFDCDVTWNDVNQFFNTLQSSCQIKGDRLRRGVAHRTQRQPISNANRFSIASGNMYIKDLTR